MHTWFTRGWGAVVAAAQNGALKLGRSRLWERCSGDPCGFVNSWSEQDASREAQGNFAGSEGKPRARALQGRRHATNLRYGVLGHG